MGERFSTIRAKLSSIGLDCVAFALLLSLTVLIQWWTGAYASEFGNHPDEAGHFITGLMVHDYLWQGDWSHPRTFAEQYYVHYPKVALGHWPPFFYLLQALWTSIFPIDRASMLLFMAVLTASLASLVYREGRSAYGWWLGMGLAVLFLLLPPVQRSSGELMTDVLMALLCFQAARAFGRFLDGNRWQDSCAFGVWSTLAIMTKATGLALALLPLPALLFSRRLDLLRRWSFWLSAIIVVLLCAPWYVLTIKMARNGLSENSPSWTFFLKSSFDYSRGLLLVFGIGLTSLALIGLSARLFRMVWHGSISGKVSSFGGWLIAFALFHCLVPNGMEERYLLPILPVIVLAIAAGIKSLIYLLAHEPLRSRLKVAAPVLIAGLFVTGAESVHHPRPISGYAPVIDKILKDTDKSALVMLISTDTSGEGMFISEVAMRDRKHNHVVLRASKVLSSSDWLGKGFELRFSDADDVSKYLIDVPIDYIILDTTIPKSDRLPDYRQLMAALEKYPQEYVLVSKFPMTRNSKVIPDAIHVYRLQSSISSRPRIIRVPMELMLGKTLEVPLP